MIYNFENMANSSISHIGDKFLSLPTIQQNYSKQNNMYRIGSDTAGHSQQLNHFVVYASNKTMLSNSFLLNFAV